MSRVVSAAAVPIVDFYGDDAEWSTSALLHSEPLIERTRLHAYRIRPHRHDRLAQLFWLGRGAGVAIFDGEERALHAPCLVLVPERCVHEFAWARDCDGYALSIASALIRDLRAQIAAPAGAFAQPHVVPAGADERWLDGLFGRIQQEYTHARPLKEALLESLLKVVAIWLARRVAPHGREEGVSRAAAHYERFTLLLEQRHRAGWTVAEYAAELGISPAHLNAICRAAGGTSALRLIHERVLLAARRELAYTDKSIADIGASLGFSEPSYFTRFFKRAMQITPKEYRRRSGTVAGGAPERASTR